MILQHKIKTRTIIIHDYRHEHRAKACLPTKNISSYAAWRPLPYSHYSSDKTRRSHREKRENQKTVYGRCRGITLGWTQPHHPKSGCEAATRSHPWVRFCGLGLLVAAGSPLGAKGPSRLTPPPYQTRLLRVPSSSTETRAGVAD